MLDSRAAHESGRVAISADLTQGEVEQMQCRPQYEFYSSHTDRLAAA